MNEMSSLIWSGTKWQAIFSVKNKNDASYVLFACFAKSVPKIDESRVAGLGKTGKIAGLDRN